MRNVFSECENAQHVLEKYCHYSHFIRLKWSHALIYAEHFTDVENMHFAFLANSEQKGEQQLCQAE